MNEQNHLKCGSIAGAYPTIRFGTETNVKNAWHKFRELAQDGPVVSDFDRII